MSRKQPRPRQSRIFCAAEWARSAGDVRTISVLATTRVAGTLPRISSIRSAILLDRYRQPMGDFPVGHRCRDWQSTVLPPIKNGACASNARGPCALRAPSSRCSIPSQAKRNGKSRRGQPWRLLCLFRLRVAAAPKRQRATRSFLTNAVFDQFLSDRSGSKYGLRSIVLYDVLSICDRRGCSN